MSLSQSTSTSPIPRSPSSSSSLGSPLGYSSSSIAGGGSYQPLCFHKDVFSIFPPTTTTGGAGTEGSSTGGGGVGFDVDGFIAECRKRVPLESVLNDLRAYGSGLDHDLVELINKDYAEFVSLSSNLIGIDQVLGELREPLDLILHDAKGFSARVTGIITNMEDKMKQRDDIAIKKEYLNLFINISNSIDKLQNLLADNKLQTTTTTTPLPVSSSSQPTSNKSTTITSNNNIQTLIITLTPYEDTTQYMERLATEYNMLRFFLTRAQKFPPALLLDKFSQKVNALVTSLDKETSKTFRTSIVNSKSSNSGSSSGGVGGGLVGPCLRMYSALNKTSSAYAIYREVVVKPRVQQIVTVANLEKGSTASSATRGSCDGLKGIFSNLLDFVKNECFPFLEEVRQSAVEYDFLANSIWPEMEETISSKIGKIYAPGIPEIFHQNYKASIEFLSQLEATTCFSLSSLQSFRSHPSYANFETRWITSVYFQLRFTDIASKVETALSQQQQLNSKIPSATTTSTTATTTTTSPLLTRTAESITDGDNSNRKDPLFKLHGTTVLWRELTRIWSPNVYIYSLTKQFMKLSLQLLSRYSSWIYAAYGSTTPHAAIGSPTIGTSSGYDMNGALKDSAGVNLKENIDDAAVSLWSQFPAEDYPHIYYDVQTLAANLQQGGQLMTLVANVIPDETTDCKHELIILLSESFAQAATSLLSHQPYLSSRVVSHLTTKGIENLQPLLGVATTYRYTDKQAPTRANYYVGNVVSLLENFSVAHTASSATPLSPPSAPPTASSSHQQQFIPQPILKDWIRRVLEAVTNRYEEMVSETLNNAQKTEELLSKMVKKKTQSAKGEGAMSDIDKISLQLFLDVTKYGQLLKDKLHIDPSTFPPYTRLLKCVSAGEKFKHLIHESNV